MWQDQGQAQRQGQGQGLRLRPALLWLMVRMASLAVGRRGWGRGHVRREGSPGNATVPPQPVLLLLVHV